MNLPDFLRCRVCSSPITGRPTRSMRRHYHFRVCGAQCAKIAGILPRNRGVVVRGVLRWVSPDTASLTTKKVICVVCDRRFRAELITKTGRRFADFRICSKRCWDIAEAVTGDLSKKSGVDGNAAFNLMLVQLLRRLSNGKNRTNDGRSSGSTVRGA